MFSVFKGSLMLQSEDLQLKYRVIKYYDKGQLDKPKEKHLTLHMI